MDWGTAKPIYAATEDIGFQGPSYGSISSGGGQKFNFNFPTHSPRFFRLYFGNYTYFTKYSRYNQVCMFYCIFADEYFIFIESFLKKAHDSRLSLN